MTLFNREQRKHLEEQYKNLSNTNIALESQLAAKTRLESDLARTNTELQKLRENLTLKEGRSQDDYLQLIKENTELRKANKTLKTADVQSEKDYVNDYQRFLMELEKSIKKAKKKSFQPSQKTSSTEDKGSKKSGKKSKDKYNFYKEKYSTKSFAQKLPLTPENLRIDKIKNKNVVKDLTYLHGINKEIQAVLNKHEIFSFKDLSSTKIAELKAILSLEGEKFENIDPLNWPIQARIADKGQWKILDDYKSKMKM